MTKTDAEIIAEIYDQYGEDYHKSRIKSSGRLFNEFIDIPATLSLVPKVLSGKQVLDAGCGSGLYAQLLAQRGAQVKGVDVSTKMIEIAQRETPVELDVEYFVGTLYALPFDKGVFDLIVCTYVLENVGNLAAVFGEFYRVLKNPGTCVISFSHPLRACAEKGKKNGQDVWVLENYFDRSMRQSDFGNGMIVPKYKRPLEDFVTALSKAGFVITRLLEPRPVGGQEVDPESFEKALRLPQLLTMSITKAP